MFQWHEFWSRRDTDKMIDGWIVTVAGGLVVLAVANSFSVTRKLTRKVFAWFWRRIRDVARQTWNQTKEDIRQTAALPQQERLAKNHEDARKQSAGCLIFAGWLAFMLLSFGLLSSERDFQGQFGGWLVFVAVNLHTANVLYDPKKFHEPYSRLTMVCSWIALYLILGIPLAVAVYVFKL